MTSIQERQKLTVVLVDNEGFASIGGLSRSKGTAGFGTRYRYRSDSSLGDDAAHKNGEPLPVDLALNAQGLGAHVIRALDSDSVKIGFSTRIVHSVVHAVEANPSPTPNQNQILSFRCALDAEHCDVGKSLLKSSQHGSQTLG